MLTEFRTDVILPGESRASVRADSAAEADAYARSVANLNNWRDDSLASAPAQGAPASPTRGDAAEADAYARSVANLNSWRDRA